MRHVMSGLAGLVATPVVWVLFGYGSYAYRTEVLTRGDAAGGFLWMLLIMLAGGLLGVVAMLRTSPVGPLIMAGTYLLVTLWQSVSPLTLFRVLSWPGELLGLSYREGGYSLSDPVYTGALGLIGAALLVSVFSRQRWLAWPGGGTPSRPEPGAPFPPGAPAAPGPMQQPGPAPEPPGEGGWPGQSAGPPDPATR